MSISIDGVTYSIINSTNARVGDGSSKNPNAILNNFSGEVKILSSVEIEGKSYEVTEIGEFAFCNSNGITNISIPNSIKIMRHNSFCGISSLKSIIIPESVTTVETFFIASMGPDNITFLGTKEPSMVNTDGDGYISASFKGKVKVPLNYEPDKTTFLKKDIERQMIIISSPNPTKRKKSCFYQRNYFKCIYAAPNFMILFLFIEK